MQVVARIIGGLGNQMFIYATARALALRIDADLILDTQSGYKNDLFKRNFLLDSFCISYRKANCFQKYDYYLGEKVKSLGKKTHFSVIPFMKYISENTSCDFVDGLLKKHILSVYLDGYWQNEAYFKDYASIIKKDFQFCQVNDLRTLSEAEIIKKSITPVAIGVRRYQELNSHQNTKVTDLDFYQKAINYIESKVDNPTFLYFLKIRNG